MFFSFNKTRLQSPPKILFVCLWCNRSFEHREEQEIGFWGKNSFLFCFSWSRSKISFFVKMGERPKMDFELFGQLPEKDGSVSNFFLNLLQNWDQKILFGSHKTWIFFCWRNETRTTSDAYVHLGLLDDFTQVRKTGSWWVKLYWKKLNRVRHRQ